MAAAGSRWVPPAAPASRRRPQMPRTWQWRPTGPASRWPGRACPATTTRSMCASSTAACGRTFPAPVARWACPTAPVTAARRHWPMWMACWWPSGRTCATVTRTCRARPSMACPGQRWVPSPRMARRATTPPSRATRGWPVVVATCGCSGPTRTPGVPTSRRRCMPRSGTAATSCHACQGTPRATASASRAGACPVWPWGSMRRAVRWSPGARRTAGSVATRPCRRSTCARTCRPSATCMWRPMTRSCRTSWPGSTWSRAT